MRKNFLWFWLAASLVFGLDRFTKVWAERTLSLDEPVVGIEGWYNWYLHYNPGAAGGIFSGEIGLLVLISVLALAAIFWFIHKGPHKGNLLLLLGLGLMVGGTLGNLFDRVFYQYVIDFINPVGESVIYNIADKGIRWGLYLSLVGLWLSGRRVRQEEENAVM